MAFGLFRPDFGLFGLSRKTIEMWRRRRRRRPKSGLKGLKDQTWRENNRKVVVVVEEEGKQWKCGGSGGGGGGKNRNVVAVEVEGKQ